MNKKIFLALIILLSFLFIIIMVAIYQINRNKVEESNVEEINNININEDIISNNEKKLFEYDNKIAQIEYDKNQLEDIDLDLIIEVMVIDENIEYILDNEEKIKTKIKEYILLNNINDVTNAMFETYQTKKDSDMMAVLFVLDNKKETKLIVIIDKKDNTIYVKEK